MGFTTFFAMKGMQKVCSKSQKSFVRVQLPSVVSAIVAVVTNTLLVLGFIALGYGSTVVNVGGESTTLLQIITGSVLIINFPVELAANVILAPAIYSVISKYAKKGV